MPRPRNPAREKQRQAHENWRRRQRELARPEIDAVDTAISNALAVLRLRAEESHADSELRIIELLERMSESILVSRGAAREHARQKVYARTRRLDADNIASLVFKT